MSTRLSLAFLAPVALIGLGFVPSSEKASSPTADWKLAKDQNSIKVYTRQAEGSEIKEYKAITTVTTKMSKLEALLEAVTEYPEWQSDIAKAKILKTLGSNDHYIYYTSDAPWPITDRDIVLHFKKRKSNSGVITYDLKGKADYIEEKEDFVRIKDIHGKWQLTPQEGGKIKVVWQLYVDPAGSIPTSLVNSFTVDGPYKSFTNLRKKVE